MAKAKAAKPKPRTRKPKQKELPGMEQVVCKPVVDAAENYWDVMIERTELSKQEHDKQEYLLMTMRKHNVTRYVLPDGRVAMISGKEKARVFKPKKKKSETAE